MYNDQVCFIKKNHIRKGCITLESGWLGFNRPILFCAVVQSLFYIVFTTPMSVSTSGCWRPSMSNCHLCCIVKGQIAIPCFFTRLTRNLRHPLSLQVGETLVVVVGVGGSMFRIPCCPRLLESIHHAPYNTKNSGHNAIRTSRDKICTCI